MSCPYLEYCRSDDVHEFDHERPHCALDDSFVSPMKADVCNDRHDFEHPAYCEIYRAAVDEGVAGEAVRDGAAGDEVVGDDVVTPEVTD